MSRGVDKLPGDSIDRAVTIGKFDGVHRGHQAVIEQLGQLAGRAEITVVTFDRHPRALFEPECSPEALISLDQKIDLLGEAGAQRVVVIEFTEKFASIGHAEFSQDILRSGLGARLVLVGQDFRYGSQGAGTLESLRSEGEQWGFEVHTVDDVVEEGGARISSTRVRELLHGGQARQAAALLGRYHCVRATVVAGHQRGRLLGYPTANLANPVEGLIPLDGVYASYVQVGEVRYPAATSIGLNPTFGDVESRVVEAHLFDFRGDLYGQRVSVHFVDYIRPMNQFPDADALAQQMHRDALKIREIVG